MALIRCYECGKEISSLAPACPSCGAPTRSTVAPPPLPTRARPVPRARQLFLGTLAVLTGLLFVLLIRGVTHQPKTPLVAASPTPATTEPATSGSPPIEMALERSGTPAAEQTPIAESAMTSSPAIEAAAATSPSPAEAETPYASDASAATATSPGATYQVIGIPQDDYLNVREGAGSDYEVITRLEPGTGGILLGTKRVTNGATTWQEITVHGQTGWVNAAYLALETQVPTSPTESSTAP